MSVPTAPAEHFAAHVSIQSRECGIGVLDRLIGPELLVDRTVAAAVVGAARRADGSVLCVTTPVMIDLDCQLDYFLGLVAPDARRRTALRERVTVVSLGDDSTRWLSTKLLDPDRQEASRARQRLAAFVDRERRAGRQILLSCFEPSEPLERLGERLGIPVDQAPARYIPLGTKAASRRLFALAGVPIPAGTPEVHSLPALAGELAPLVRQGVRRFVLKLSSTEYGAGYGNATLDLSDLADLGDRLAGAVLERLPGARVIDPSFGWGGFLAGIPTAGVIGEELIEGEEVSSPSYQGRISASGAQAVSTHEQILAGNKQTFVGNSFPAADPYRARVMELGLRVGEALRAEGVDRGDYGVDFIAARRAGGWQVFGCEINLRATATKHGFDMVTTLLGTKPDENGELLVGGQPRVYLASDAVASPHYVGLRPSQLIPAVTRSPVHYDRTRARGVVLHMLSGLPTYGKFGAVCIGATMAEAQQLMQDLRAHADELACAPCER